jgi:hypothetical protein
MIDIAQFYTLLGVPRSPGQDEQLMLPGEVRVQVDESGWTALFEGLQADARVLSDALEISRQAGAAIPFVSRSGHLGMKWQSLSSQSETSAAVLALRAGLRQVTPS